MCGSGTHRSNARYLGASVGGTLLVLTILHATLWSSSQLGVVTSVFGAGQLSGIAGFAFRRRSLCQLRAHDDPPAGGFLILYLVVSVTSTVALGMFVFLAAFWLLLKSTVRHDSDPSTYYFLSAIFALFACQMMGTIAAARSLCCPGRDRAGALAAREAAQYGGERDLIEAAQRTPVTHVFESVGVRVTVEAVPIVAPVGVKLEVGEEREGAQQP